MKSVLFSPGFLCFVSCLLMFCPLSPEASGSEISSFPGDGVYSVSTPGLQVIVRAEEGREARLLYFGPRVEDGDCGWIAEGEGVAAYPVYGMDCPSEAALSVVHSDRNPSLEMVVEGAEVTSDGTGETLRVSMRDRIYDFRVDLCWRAFWDVDMVEAWAEFLNGEEGPVTLRRFDSAFLPLRRGAWISHLGGTWADEANLTEEPLNPGELVIKNKDGVRNSQTSHAEVMFSLDGRPEENSGDVIGAALCYGGNFELRVDTDDSPFHRFFAGINPDESAYRLEPGESFVTPALALTYSGAGLGGASRNFHDWARSHALAHGDRERKVLLNSWEGVYFNVNEKGMETMMGDIAGMGGELFVMDDGWFGDKYPRRNDSSSLGDWVTDRRKLPHGIGHLVSEASKKGISFGIWIEPEMTNTVSELYEEHPEWAIHAPGREPVLGRGGTQLVLDLSNPEVQDFVFGVVDSLMTRYPGIDYIKWDANAPIFSSGSSFLAPDRQDELNIRYHRGLVSVCERIREKYPDLTIQACASGGGRANYGILPWFDEFWVSDDTDALQRIYMQWGTSYFFPAIAMASHVSASPNHQTGRRIPLKFRIDVAMSGRLGIEIQPRNMTEEEREQCRRAIEEYKEIRPVVQFGDLYRLESPYGGARDRGASASGALDSGSPAASLMYCSKDRGRAVVYWWKLRHFVGMRLPAVRMAGLDPARHYRVRELDRVDSEPLPFEGAVFSGGYLMTSGLEMPLLHTLPGGERTDWASRVLYLEAVD